MHEMLINCELSYPNSFALLKHTSKPMNTFSMSVEHRKWPDSGLFMSKITELLKVIDETLCGLFLHVSLLRPH